MKKFIALLSALCVFFALPAAAADRIEPTDAFYVADYANVIDADTEEMIIERNVVLEEQCGGQIVVATVDFLNGEDIGDYIYQLFNDWEVGDKDEDNGLLILLVIGEENYWALQGTGIANKLTSGDIDNILYDYLEDDFAVGDYDAGVEKVFLAFYEEFESIYGFRFDNSGVIPDEYPVEYPDRDRGGWSFGKIFVILFVILFVIAVIASLGGHSGGTSVPRTRTRTIIIPTSRSYRRPMAPPPPPRSPGGFGGFGSSRPGGSFGGSRPSASRPSVSRPSSSRPSAGRPASRPSSGGGRSFGGARGGGGASRGGGAGRRR